MEDVSIKILLRENVFVFHVSLLLSSLIQEIL